jgi:formamidopyrimidine-DNA glycosylase
VPELPEVETVRRGLNQATLGQIIQGGEVLLPRTIAYPDAVESFLVGITGQRLTQWHRRGKYLLADLQTTPGESGGWLGVHLRMTGQLLWCDGVRGVSPSRHCRVRLWFDTGKELHFLDQRTFGRLWWVPPTESPDGVISGMGRLGPEPFSDAFSSTYLYQTMGRRRRPIKNALLDQTLVAGIGNIYADEALFLSGIRPTTLCVRIGRQRIIQLHQSILAVLTQSIEAGGTTFSDFRHVDGVNGNYGGVAWVYGRAGEPCRVCSMTIQRIKLAGRSAHYCPNCQR